MIYWFIGQAGCGKTTLSKQLKAQFDAKGVPSIHLDGDDLRRIFGGTYHKEHFTKEYRDTNTRKLQVFVEHINSQGVNVIVSTVNSDRSVREELKQRNINVREILVVNSGNHVREEYKRDDFEDPIENFIKVDTNGLTAEQSLRTIWDKL